MDAARAHPGLLRSLGPWADDRALDQLWVQTGALGSLGSLRSRSTRLRLAQGKRSG